MNEEIKAEWVRKLESGEYPKGTGVLTQLPDDLLKTELRFCCLGVLCEMAADAGVVNRYEDPDNRLIAYASDDVVYAETMILPQAVSRWAGLLDSNPTVDALNDNTFVTVAYVNDNSDSFAPVVKLIKEQL